MTRRRLAIFASHPIQYQAPWFTALARDPEIEVKAFFSHVPDAAAQGTGFGRAMRWDLPLREGYPNEVLDPDGKGESLRVLGAARSALRDFRPDAALIMGWHHRSLTYALTACRLLGVPVILRGESNDRRSRPVWTRMLHRFYVGQAAAVLAIGEANASFFRKAGVDADRIFMARYGVDNDRFAADAARLRPQRAAIRANWGIPDGAFCVGFFGKLETKKRPLDMLRALQIASARGLAVHGLVVGDGILMKEARALAASAEIDVTFAGFLNQSEISKGYVAADAIVLPSDEGETWGLVCNEAMACGTPAIVSEKVGCAGDLVIDGVTGAVVAIAAPGAIAEQLCEWVADRAGFEELRQRAIAHVHSHYGFDQAVEGLKRAMASVLAR